MPKTKNAIAFVGCGYTPLTRSLEKPEVDLAVEACRNAAEDAGLDPAQLDGINIQVHHWPPPSTADIAAGLGMRDIRWQADGGIGVASAGRAALAVDTGECDYAVVCKVMNTVAPVATPDINPGSGGVPGPTQFEVPYGLGYSMQRIGFTVRRWMHRYGITHEQVGWLCVTQREHALLNPQAFFKKALTIEDYMSARWISDPVRVLDCDYPVNGAYAYIVTRQDRAKDLRQTPVYLRSWVESEIPLLDFHLIAEDLGPGPSPWLTDLYRDSGVSPAELDVWMLYDGFSFFAPQWMESLGLVPRGESGNYMQGGKNIRFDGEHPVNTHGGQISEGRLHGAGHLLEAVQQLRGNCGDRQAKKADYAVVSTAFPNTGAAAILGK